MLRLRHLERSIVTAAFAALFATVVAANGQESSVQKLVERGALNEAVQQAGSDAGNPEATYLAAFALVKMNDNDGARERYNQLQNQENESWKAIGEAGARLIERDLDGAMEAANRAVAADEGNPYAHYQLAIVAAQRDDWGRSLQALERSIELKPDFAYAHYYAGQAAQRVGETAKSADHYRAFLRLAPDAPERPSVQSLLRTIG
jgi:tetratricopeptide (TPR) repeat protein